MNQIYGSKVIYSIGQIEYWREKSGKYLLRALNTKTNTNHIKKSPEADLPQGIYFNYKKVLFIYDLKIKL